MKKFIPLVLGLMFPLTGAFADSFTDEAVAFCRSKGGNYTLGTMIEEGDKYCRQVTCKKTNSDRYEIPAGAAGPEANVEATKKVCVAKSVIDGTFDTNGAQSGAQSGSQSGAQSGSQSGAQSGVQSGSQSGAQSGSSGGDDGAIFCEELEGEGRIEPGGLCYNECKPKRDWKTLWTSKKESFARKSCIECVLRYPGVFKVKKEYLPRDSNGKIIGDNSVSLGRGVTVKTGEIVCRDSKGNIVRIAGSACPTGYTVFTGGTTAGGSGTVVVGGGVSSGVGAGGTIIIGGGVAGGVGAGAGVKRPAFCDSPKRSDIEACEAWIRNNARFQCSSSSDPHRCMGDDYYEIRSRYERDCVNCGVGGRQQSTLSGVAEIVGAIAPPLAHFGAAYVGARAFERSSRAWAGAAAAGFEQCRLAQNNYLQYLAANELPGLTPEQQRQMNCNGYGLGGYAGLGGGLGGYYGAGYTPGFIGGMMGPYGGYGMGGMGGYVGGAVGGYVGGIGIVGGMAGGGYPGGYVGGYVGGIAGGMTGGYPGGYAGGMAGGYPGGYVGGAVGGIQIAGGMAGGGYPGGYAGGFAGGMAGGYPGGYAGGMAGGYPGGYAGGAIGGIGIAGGMAGGWNGGFAGGMAGGMTGGWNGGFGGGGWGGGFPGAGGWGSGVGGGFGPGYGGGHGSGYWGASGGFGNPQMDYMGSMQAANRDRMLQQQGMSYQMGMGGMGGYGGFGSAGFSPMNAGFGLSAGFGIGGGFGAW